MHVAIHFNGGPNSNNRGWRVYEVRPDFPVPDPRASEPVEFVPEGQTQRGHENALRRAYPDAVELDSVRVTPGEVRNMRTRMFKN